MENVFGETVGRVTSSLSRIFTGVSICCFLVNFFFFFFCGVLNYFLNIISEESVDWILVLFFV